MADSIYEFLVRFFVNYLPFTPTSVQVDTFRKDLSLVSPYLMEAALIEVKNGTQGRNLSDSRDWRPAIFRVYNRKVAEHAQLFPIFHSFETAFRSTLAVELESFYGIKKWWQPINEAVRSGRDARSVTRIGNKAIRRDTANAIAQLIYSIDGTNLNRGHIDRCTNGFEFLEHCELSYVARLIEVHWSLFSPKFVRNQNRLSLGHFKNKFRLVREARNDVYHHKSVARTTDVVAHAEDLLDYLGFSLGFVFEKIWDAAPQEPRFSITPTTRHGTW